MTVETTDRPDVTAEPRNVPRSGFLRIAGEYAPTLAVVTLLTLIALAGIAVWLGANVLVSVATFGPLIALVLDGLRREVWPYVQRGISDAAKRAGKWLLAKVPVAKLVNIWTSLPFARARSVLRWGFVTFVVACLVVLAWVGYGEMTRPLQVTFLILSFAFVVLVAGQVAWYADRRSRWRQLNR